MARVVLVCGGRHYNNKEKIEQVLSMFQIKRLIVGDATGADNIAAKITRSKNIPVVVYKADWNKHGRAAGPIRNKLMLEDNPDIDLVIAFPGGKGTANMMRQARERQIEVFDIEELEGNDN